MVYFLVGLLFFIIISNESCVFFRLWVVWSAGPEKKASNVLGPADLRRFHNLVFFYKINENKMIKSFHCYTQLEVSPGKIKFCILQLLKVETTIKTSQNIIQFQKNPGDTPLLVYKMLKNKLKNR